jgi:hypothetical protein
MPESVCTMVVNGALYFRHAFRVRRRAHVPDIAENRARRRLEDARQLAVTLPGADNRLFVDRALGRTELRTFLRDVRLRAIETHVALALLLGVVKRVRVEKRPDELPADVLEAEFEVRVLVDGVMPAEVGPRTDHHALLFGDLLGSDEVRRIAGARRGHRRIERMREGISQRDARRRGFDLVSSR